MRLKGFFFIGLMLWAGSAGAWHEGDRVPTGDLSPGYWEFREGKITDQNDGMEKLAEQTAKETDKAHPREHPEFSEIWIGTPVIDCHERAFPYWEPDYEIGLREDGVVIWRKAKK